MFKLAFRLGASALLFGLCSVCSAAENAEPLPPVNWECCPDPLQCYQWLQAPKPEMIGASHTEGKGLGYTRGYTSLDLFLSQPFCQVGLIPFLDLRGHMFNDAEYAANAGIGLRWVHRCRIFGVNWFYDYFETPRRPYNQVGMGLELLSESWGVFVNGYLPVGHKQTDLYEFTYIDFLPFLMKGTEQFAMKGLDAEFGYRFCNIWCFDFYTGIGPYYYWGKSTATENAFGPAHKQVVGGRFSASASFMDYVSVEGDVTYDNRFKWGGQATIAITIPFDFTFNTGDCAGTCCLQQRLYKPVRRNEIMVIDRIHRYSTNPNILDPTFNP